MHSMKTNAEHNRNTQKHTDTLQIIRNNGFRKERLRERRKNDTIELGNWNWLTSKVRQLTRDIQPAVKLCSSKTMWHVKLEKNIP